MEDGPCRGGSASADFYFSSEDCEDCGLFIAALSRLPFTFGRRNSVSNLHVIPAFDNALSAFNVKIEIDRLSNPSGSASADFYFSSELVMKRVVISIKLMDVVAKINDLKCEFIVLSLLDLVIGNGGSPPYPLHLGGLVSTLQVIPAFDNALSAFNVKIEIDRLSNPSEEVLKVIMEDGPCRGGSASADFYFSSELVMKRVVISIKLMDVVAKINDLK
ncbi:hypothetical protein Tco_1331733, partial [Tanacetum coccineum]